MEKEVPPFVTEGTSSNRFEAFVTASGCTMFPVVLLELPFKD